MLEDFVKSVLSRLIKDRYPHIQYPAVVIAVVKKADKLNDTYELQDVTVHDDDNIQSYTRRVAVHRYQYDLEVVNRLGNPDDTFPPILGVRSGTQLRVGDKVAVGLAYGDVPVMLGEVLE